MNWGKGIIAGMILFMLFILTLCAFMVMAPKDDYDHQYYEKGLTFNQYYDKEQQVIKDHAQPTATISGDFLKVKFASPAIGSVQLQRPSNNSLDKTYKFDSGDNAGVEFSIKSITKGKWLLIFDWKSNNNAYLYQKSIFLK